MADYDKTPNPAEWGHCCCCEKPLSEYDWWHSQGHHCQECWNHLGVDENGRCFCQIHEIDKAILVADGGIPLRVNFALGRSYADSIVGAVLGLKGKEEDIIQIVREITHETLHIAFLKNGGEQASDALDNLITDSRGTPHFPHPKIVSKSDLMSPPANPIQKILKHIPEHDLEGIEEIIILDDAPKGTPPTALGRLNLTANPIRIELYARGILAEKNPTEALAHTLYHEIGHAVQIRNSKFRRKLLSQKRQLNKLLDELAIPLPSKMSREAKLEWAETSDLDKFFVAVKLELWMEHFPDSYADEKLKEYRSRMEGVGHDG